MTSKFVADRSEHHRPFLAALRRLVPRDRRFFALFNRQAQLILVETGGVAVAAGAIVVAVRARPQPLPPRLTEGERAAHLAFVASLGEGAIWRDYLSVDRRVSETAA